MRYIKVVKLKDIALLMNILILYDLPDSLCEVGRRVSQSYCEGKKPEYFFNKYSTS
jgi:hypothetical protein